jgi:epsilon-lactone hydrolase
MRTRFATGCQLVAGVTALFFTVPASADPVTDVEFTEVAAAQTAANATAGPRTSPGQVLPVPTADVSPQSQTAIAAPYAAIFAVRPKSNAEWQALVTKVDGERLKVLPAVRASLGVSVKSITIGGVKAFEITPAAIPEANRNRLVLHFHGGAYVLNGGEAGTYEGMLIASIGKFRVITIDYRMPPTAPFPAALDDSVAAYRAALKTIPAKNIAFVGTSAGAGLLMATALRARDEKLPMPGALAAGTPWVDLSKTGDSYFTNEWVDNILVTWDGMLGAAAALYAGKHDLKEPYLSPIYGDFAGLPPTILTTGTRDLFLSNTVRAHRKLRRAGVEADLNVYEGMSHGVYLDPRMPEMLEVFSDITRFLDGKLSR